MDEVLEALMDRAPLAELEPGAVGDERALPERGLRTSARRAPTWTQVGVGTATRGNTHALAELAAQQRREAQARRPR